MIGAGSVLGAGVGAGAALVGGAGGGFGAELLLVASGAGGRLVAVLAAGGAELDSVPPLRVGFGVRVAFGGVRWDRDAAGGFRVAGRGLTVPAGFTCTAGVWAGVALAIAAARAPVAITEPAATPLLTSDSRRSARSRWWAGGEAIESLSARA